MGLHLMAIGLTKEYERTITYLLLRFGNMDEAISSWMFDESTDFSYDEIDALVVYANKRYPWLIITQRSNQKRGFNVEWLQHRTAVKLE